MVDHGSVTLLLYGNLARLACNVEQTQKIPANSRTAGGCIMHFHTVVDALHVPQHPQGFTNGSLMV